MNRFYEQQEVDQKKTRIFSIRWVDQQSPIDFLREHFQVIHIK